MKEADMKRAGLCEIIRRKPEKKVCPQVMIQLTGEAEPSTEENPRVYIQLLRGTNDSALININGVNVAKLESYSPEYGKRQRVRLKTYGLHRGMIELQRLGHVDLSPFHGNHRTVGLTVV